MQILARTHTDADCSETIVCHCLQVSESTLADAIAVCGLASVREVCRETGAGGGCTACHARLREMLRHTRQTEPAY
ncbi:MAG: (2Fe-2S)-binding protein [Planctomycetaceae bacterium]|nr:(2Fe-2S)-binding protein [Planctomycetaceae bacterium]